MPNGFGPDGKIDQYYDAPMLVRAVDIFKECREQQCITIFGIPRDMPKNQRGEALWSVMKNAATNAGMANIEVTRNESCDATSVVMSIAEYMKATHPNATALLVCYSPWVADHFKGKGAAKVYGSWNYRVIIPTQWVPEPVLSRRLIYAALGILHLWRHRRNGHFSHGHGLCITCSESVGSGASTEGHSGQDSYTAFLFL